MRKLYQALLRHTLVMATDQAVTKWMPTTTFPLTHQTAQNLTNNQDNLGSVVGIIKTKHQNQHIIQTDIQCNNQDLLDLWIWFKILMEFQGNLLLERSLSRKTEMVLRMKSSMLMVILLPGVQVKQILIRKQNSPILLQQTKVIKLQFHTL